MANTKNNHEDVITQIEANRTHLIRIEKKLDALLKSPVEEVKGPSPVRPFQAGDIVVSDTHFTCILKSKHPYLVSSVMGGRLMLDIPGHGNCGYSDINFRHAYLEEIATYEQEKEWAKVTELQEGDACEVTREECDRLIAKAVAGDLTDEKGYDDAQFLYWRGAYKPYITRSDKWTGMSKASKVFPVNNIPVSVWEKRLEGTIASRKAEQEASKLSKLKFGVKVNTPRGEGIYWRSITHGRHAVVFDNGSEHYNLSDITIVG